MPISINWCEYAVENFKDFKGKIEALKNNDTGWNIRIEYNILNGYIQGKRAVIKKLIFEPTDLNLDKIKEYWNKAYIKKIFSSKGHSPDPVKIMLGALLGENNPEYEETVNLIDEYWRNKEKPSMGFRWTLALEYKINKEPIATDPQREDIKKKLPSIFYEKTKEGLNLFGIGDDFVNSVFN